MTATSMNLNLLFANHGDEGEIYPLTTIEIAEAQKKDRRSMTSKMLKHQKRNIHFQVIQDTKVMYKNNK
jgi:hypothetical protein